MFAVCDVQSWRWNQNIHPMHLLKVDDCPVEFKIRVSRSQDWEKTTGSDQRYNITKKYLGCESQPIADHRYYEKAPHMVLRHSNLKALELERNPLSLLSVKKAWEHASVASTAWHGIRIVESNPTREWLRPSYNGFLTQFVQYSPI